MVAAGGDSITGSASDAYKRGAIGRFFLGTHYRPTWQMPVTAPVFRPARLGLTPVKTGGSMQTLNLRLVDKAGHEYVLRSVDKDLTRALPPGKESGPQTRLLQDQTAAVHPYGALLAAGLAEAAGVPHAQPILYRVPTDEAVLGDFQNQFAGRLVYLEERPDGNWSGTGKLRNAARLVSSGAMLRHRYLGNLAAPVGTPANSGVVDVTGPGPARAWLRARLLDMYLGDWSRREDQWRWIATTELNQTPRYYPVPRDRDHAFSRYADGVLPALAVLFKHRVTSFGPRIEKPKRFVEASEALDRTLLGWLTVADFQAEADTLVRRLSDKAIDRSLATWPVNVRRLEELKFRRILLARRQQLPAAAKALYAYLAQDVILPGTDGADTYALSTTNDGSVTITWTARADTVATGPASTYARTFNRRETRRIRIYGLGGNDRLELGAGLPANAPQVEFYDGPGRDRALRSEGAETPRWLNLRVSGDANDFNGLPGWARPVDKNVPARDYDGAGFLLRHRLD